MSWDVHWKTQAAIIYTHRCHGCTDVVYSNWWVEVYTGRHRLLSSTLTVVIDVLTLCIATDELRCTLEDQHHRLLSSTLTVVVDVLMLCIATDELRCTLEDQHHRQIAELERDVADARRQHTKTGLSLLQYCELMYIIILISCVHSRHFTDMQQTVSIYSDWLYPHWWSSIDSWIRSYTNWASAANESS